MIAWLDVEIIAAAIVASYTITGLASVALIGGFAAADRRRARRGRREIEQATFLMGDW